MRTDKHITNIFGADVTGRGPPRTTRKNCSSGKAQRLTNWGENDAIDFQKTNYQIFSTTGFEQAYERTAAEGKREKFASAADRRDRQSYINHKKEPEGRESSRNTPSANARGNRQKPRSRHRRSTI